MVQTTTIHPPTDIDVYLRPDASQHPISAFVNWATSYQLVESELCTVWAQRREMRGTFPIAVFLKKRKAKLYPTNNFFCVCVRVCLYPHIYVINLLLHFDLCCYSIKRNKSSRCTTKKWRCSYCVRAYSSFCLLSLIRDCYLKENREKEMHYYFVRKGKPITLSGAGRAVLMEISIECWWCANPAWCTAILSFLVLVEQENNKLLYWVVYGSWVSGMTQTATPNTRRGVHSHTRR